MLRRFFGFSIILVATLSCARDDTASAHPRKNSANDGDGVPPRPSVVTPVSQPYRVVAVSAGGTITGTVDFDGTPPAPQVIRPNDVNVCGNTITANDVTMSGTKVVGAVVWLTDIRNGKGFPMERRFDLTNDNCLLDPFVQVISTASTLNVSNDDRGLHTNRLINVATGQVAAIAPFNDDGEVVPIDRLNEPMEVEVVCEQHPWTHAWVVVLDHPYFAQTSKTGTFSIDGIPAGKYRMRAWYPNLGFVDDSVTVNAGQQTTVSLHIKPTGAPPAPAVIGPAASSTPTASTTPAASSTPTASSTDTIKK